MKSRLASEWGASCSRILGAEIEGCTPTINSLPSDLYLAMWRWLLELSPGSFTNQASTLPQRQQPQQNTSFERIFYSKKVSPHIQDYLMIPMENSSLPPTSSMAVQVSLHSRLLTTPMSHLVSRHTHQLKIKSSTELLLHQ